MPESAKIAISLPMDLMRRMERLRKQTGESRSAFIRRMIVKALEERTKAEKIRAYVEGYRKHPESVEEIEEAAASTSVLAEEPWQ